MSIFRTIRKIDRQQGTSQIEVLGNNNSSDQLALHFKPQLLASIRRAWMFFYAVFERFLAAILLLISLPLFIVVPIIIKLQDGGPVFYISRRMGKNKQLFNMYKFRSLAPQAKHDIGAQLLHHSHNAEIPCGRFLRDTRIDEIPQLLNVLKGDMHFWGPRPERPELYAEHCAQIVDYDRRFAVRPGLFGYSQIFTPHSTPKRIRKLIDNRYIKRYASFKHFVFSTSLIMTFLLLRMARKGSLAILSRLSLKLRKARAKDRRALERIRPGRLSLEIDGDDNSTSFGNLRLIDINEEYMYLHTSEQFPDATMYLRMKIKTGSSWLYHGGKLKTVRVMATVYRNLKIKSGPYRDAYVIRYSAYSPLNRYLIDKYLLKKSIM